MVVGDAVARPASSECSRVTEMGEGSGVKKDGTGDTVAVTVFQYRQNTVRKIRGYF